MPFSSLAEARARWKREEEVASEEVKVASNVTAAIAARRQREQAAESGGVWLGMTKKAAEQSPWGRPTSINSSTYAFGVHEQWVYGRGYL